MSSLLNGINGCTSEHANLKKILVLDPRFECPICLTCLKEPVLTSCGHRFCQECINKWLQKEGSCCPIDGKELTPDQDLFPDNYTRREIAQQVIECPFPDCSKKIPLLESERHIIDTHEQVNGEIGNETFPCPFKNIGCDSVFKSKSQLVAHTQSYLPQHVQLLSVAHSGLSMRFEKSHSDGKAEEAEMWEAPSKESSNSSGNSQPLQGLMKTLYERIVLLEQTSREQDIQLANLRDKVESLTTENVRLKQELPLRICGGTLVWHITNVNQKISSMTKDNSIFYYSDGFYTSYSGYKFCARLNISPHDREYLSLLIHLMRGENDHSVSWPFSGRIAFTVIHPTKPEKSIREVMCSRPELDAFKRPSGPISMRGFGYTEFVLLKELSSEGFVSVDDSLNIKIQITCV